MYPHGDRSERGVGHGADEIRSVIVRRYHIDLLTRHIQAMRFNVFLFPEIVPAALERSLTIRQKTPCMTFHINECRTQRLGKRILPMTAERQ